MNENIGLKIQRTNELVDVHSLFFRMRFVAHWWRRIPEVLIPSNHLAPTQTKKLRWKSKTLFFNIVFCSTLRFAACTRFTGEQLLSGAFCVQRFGNRVILQLIPLIALCCVLQRNRKPSHPSRHVVGAVVKGRNKEEDFFFPPSSGE